MTCEAVQASLSAVADGEPPELAPAELDEHVRSCPACRSFDERMHEVRQLLRFEPLGDIPDLAPAVLARLPDRGRRSWRAGVAAAVVGAVAGASFVGIGRDPATVAAADLPERVVDVQPAVTTLSARLVVDAGDHRWTGTFAYEAPESLAVVLRDTEGELLATVADEGSWWTAGPVRCRPSGSTGCAPDRLEAVEDRPPFADDAPVPLELVAPVDSLARSAELEQLPERDGAVGVRVTAAQVAGLLEGIDPTGALRPVHPSDPVDLWLDSASLVPVDVVVTASELPERARWAAAEGLTDAPGDQVLRIRLDDLVVDGDLPPGAFPRRPAGAEIRDGGFDDGDVPEMVPVPGDLPEGLQAGRAGMVGDVGIRTWADGRAWLAIRATEEWAGEQLFGGLGDFVVPVHLGAAGQAYASADGTRIALRTADLDIVVQGSIGPDALRRVAASLGVVGVPVDKGWATSEVAGLADARSRAPDLLVADDVDGFDGPAVRIGPDEVTLRYTGPGSRMFLLVRSDDAQLAPPLDADVTAVPVRGVTGRWSPGTGDLEWVEAGHARALRSPTLTLTELLDIAEQLRPA